jgi:chaperone modulatory protein CbpM
MIEFVTQSQLLEAVPNLSRARLDAFLAAELIAPIYTDSEPVYRPIDLARLELLCELADHFDLEGDALGVVIGLLDQLHATRRELNALALAVSEEPYDLRQRIGTRLITILTL